MSGSVESSLFSACNFVGGSDEEIARRREALPAGLDIVANPDDGQTCWYAAETERGSTFIAPFDFDAPPRIVAAPFAPDARYYLIPMYPNAEANPLYQGPEYAEASILRSQFAVFVQGDDRDTTRPGLETALLERWLRETGEHGFGLHRIDWEPASVTGPGTVHLTSFNADYTPPLPKARAHPPVTPFHCPEYSLHRDPAVGDARLEQWELYRDTGSPSRYRAIPRVEFQNHIDASGMVERWKVYEQDLRTKLGYSPFMQGDDGHFRYLRDVAFASASGVVGLYCPVFIVTIDEYALEEVTCLERFLRQPRDVIRGRTFVHTDGYLLPGDHRDTRRYLSHERRVNTAAAAAKWLQLRRDDPAKMLVNATEVARSSSCVEYQLTARPAPEPMVPSEVQVVPEAPMLQTVPDSTASFEDEPAPEAPMSRPDIARAAGLMSSPKGEAKVEAYGQLGSVTVVPPSGYRSSPSLIDQIVATLDPTQRNELCLVIDQSGSMADDIRTVHDQVAAAIQKRLGQDDSALSLCLVRFRNENVDVLVPLDPSRGQTADIARVQAGLVAILEHVGGRIEYIARAAELAVNELAKGRPGSKRSIVVLTDEPGDPWPTGTNLEEGLAAVRRQAEAIGAEFRIIMMEHTTGALKEEQLLAFLNATRGAESREEMLQAILSDELFTRRFFAYNMHRVRDLNARNSLAEGLAADKDTRVRWDVLLHLRSIPDPVLRARIRKQLISEFNER